MKFQYRKGGTWHAVPRVVVAKCVLGTLIAFGTLVLASRGEWTVLAFVAVMAIVVYYLDNGRAKR